MKPGIESPQLLTDLYRDLRERRLLPLVLVLVVGMAVVPIALSSSPETAPPPPPPSPVATKTNVPAESVVVANPGVRDYRRRLDSPTDPFLQQFTTPITPPAGSTGTSSDAGSTAAGTTGVAETGGATSAPSAGGTTTVQTEVRTDNKVVFYRLKVRTGLVGGDMRTRDEIGPSSQLPSRDVPALVFLGANFNGDLEAQRAYFLVSNGVSSISGDGVCSLGDPCQLVSVRPGQFVDLVWIDGQQYRVKLLSFERHVRDEIPGDFVSGADSGSGGRGK